MGHPGGIVGIWYSSGNGGSTRRIESCPSLLTNTQASVVTFM